MTALVDAEPLYASNLTVDGATHNVVYVVTEHDSVMPSTRIPSRSFGKVSVLGVNESTSDTADAGRCRLKSGLRQHR